DAAGGGPEGDDGVLRRGDRVAGGGERGRGGVGAGVHGEAVRSAGGAGELELVDGVAVRVGADPDLRRADPGLTGEVVDRGGDVVGVRARRRHRVLLPADGD